MRFFQVHFQLNSIKVKDHCFSHSFSLNISFLLKVKNKNKKKGKFDFFARIEKSEREELKIRMSEGNVSACVYMILISQAESNFNYWN